MKILLLTQIVPYPLDSGPKVKTYHVLRYLSERGHRVTLATFMRTNERKAIEPLRPLCAAIHPVPLRRSIVSDARAYVRSVRSDEPFLVARDASAEMAALVRQLVRERDVIVHADQLTMGQFALEANCAPRLLDAHNAVWSILARARTLTPMVLRLFLALEIKRLKSYEGQLCRQMNAVLTVSENDANRLEEVGADRDKIAVVPIAIDCARYKMLSRLIAVPNILILGTLFYPPTADGVRWFLRKIFPLVQKKIPGARLTIVGAQPPRDIKYFARQNPESVTVAGYVSDLTPFLGQATAIAVPVRAGGGMRVRLLEAFGRGVPVVTTSLGAEGIDARHEEHLLVADAEGEFAEATARLLQDEFLRARLIANARRLVEEKYDWQRVLPKLEQVYESIAQV